MKQISVSWERLAQNAESKEVSFETFTFQVAYAVYRAYGDFEYDYNTPGSEFYLHLTRDCPDLKAKAGQVVGWQAKFWLNHSDTANTSLEKTNRAELVEGFRKSKEYQKGLVSWVICTPGQPINTKPHFPKDALIKELAAVDPDIIPLFWNKPLYEAMLHQNYDRLAPLYAHYFGELFFGRALCERRSRQTLENLKTKYDIDLYVPGKGDEGLWDLIHLDRGIDALKASFTGLRHPLSWTQDKSNCQYPSDASPEMKKRVDRLHELTLRLAGDLAALDDMPQSLRDVARAFDIYRAQWNPIVAAYNSLRDISPKSDIHFFLDFGLRQLLDVLVGIRSQFDTLLQTEVHLIGSAGYGKTCLACHIADECLSQAIPAILLTGRMLSGASTIKDQLVSALDLPATWTLRNVFACLNNLGFLQRKKVPFIIDGLNETVPDCSRWLDDVKEIAALSREFPHVLFVTTTRDAYCQRVYGVNSAEDVPDHIVLQGFTDYNVDSAVKKYFTKYRVATTNWSVSHKIFVHPLLLKMFCVVNEGSSIEVTHVSVFTAIEEYVDSLACKVASKDGDTNKFLLQTIRDRITELGRYLWQSKCRSINYLRDLPRILDPDWDGRGDWRLTLTCRLLDEGLLLSREVRKGEEVVEFSYDMVAGVVIAKAVFFASPATVPNVLASPEVLERLGNASTAPNHPLAEDITKALIYLWPKYSEGRQLVESAQYAHSLKLSFEMVDVVCASATGRNAIRTVLSQLNRSDTLLHGFCRGSIRSVIDHGSLACVEVLTDFLFSLSPAQVDQIWTETIRVDRRAIVTWLTQQIPRRAPTAEYSNILTVLAFLSSSTCHHVRDHALLEMFQLGLQAPDVLISVTAKMTQYPDLHAVEAVFAALCGVLLRASLPESQRLAAKIRSEVLPTLSTTHVAILDFLDTMFSSAEQQDPSKYDTSWLDRLPRSEWPIDPSVSTKNSGLSMDWGFGPIDYDFMKNNVSSITHDEDYNSVATKEEIVGRLISQIRKCGYDLDALAAEDRKVSAESEKERDYYNRYTSRYSTKVSETAFRELCGRMLLDGILTPARGRFRLLYGGIDPTFPCKPPKQQIFVDCHIARLDEPIELWIDKQPTHPYFDALKSLPDPNSAHAIWSLVYAHAWQSGRNKSRLDIWWHTCFCPKPHVPEIIRELSAGGDIERPNEYHRLMAGEIPWRLIPDPEDYSNHKDPKNTIEFYSWEASGSILDGIGSVPFLHSEAARQLGLKYVPDGLFYVNAAGEPMSRMYSDKTSVFLYVRTDAIQTLCAKWSKDIVWSEQSVKYGTRDGGKEYVDGLRSEACFADVLRLSTS